MERQRNPRGQGDRLRTEIVQAASIMLAASGDAGQITLRGVARQVGIAATSVYLHFPDVAHLVAEAMAGFFGELERAVAGQALETRHPPPCCGCAAAPSAGSPRTIPANTG